MENNCNIPDLVQAFSYVENGGSTVPRFPRFIEGFVLTILCFMNMLIFLLGFFVLQVLKDK